MASPYSDDLRQKAIEAVDRGEGKSQVCRLLSISGNTLDLWLKRRQEIGSFSAKRTIYRVRIVHLLIASLMLIVSSRLG